MESLGLSIIVAIIIVWYFGSAINAIISKSGKMAEREYEVFEREQAFRLMKGKEDLKAKIKEFQRNAKSEMTDAELDEALGLA